MSHDFADYYDQELEPLLRKLEERRLRAWAGWRRTLAWLGLPAVAGVAAGLVLSRPLVALLTVALFAGLAAATWWWQFDELPEVAERRIVGAVARFVDPGLQFDPHGHIGEDEFRGAGLFRSDIDRYRGEDLVWGRIGRTEIRFSEVHAEYRTTRRDSDGDTRTTWHTIFRGLFVVADFNKEFRGVTVVLPDVAERALGWLGQTLQDTFDLFRHGKLVKLEDPEFEREFVVYGDDQVEARYILTPALMERLLEFKRRTGRRCWFSFVGNAVNIAVETDHDMLEVSVWRSFLDREALREHLRDLELATGVVEVLDLNTRIWTKE